MEISGEAVGDAARRSASGRQRGLIVLCAANNYDTIKVADQHMAESLAANCDLLYVDPPRSPFSARRNPALAAGLEEPRLRRMSAGFWRLTPLVPPFPMRAGMRSVTEQLVRRAIRNATTTIGTRVAAVISPWTTLDVFGICDEQVKIWWAQDDFAAGAELMHISRKRTAAGERSRAHSCDFVVAANPEVAARWRSQGCEVDLIPYGCDPDAFACVGSVAPAQDVCLTSPVAVVMGQFNGRTDPRLLLAIADAGLSLLLVGPGPRQLGSPS